MIIVLKGADFSANNIGKLDITTEIDSKVVDAMSKLTKYPCSTTNEYAKALNTLYLSLKNYGIYDKITLLSLPIMSATIEQSGYNFVDGSVSNEIPMIYYLGDNGEMRYSGTFSSDNKSGGFDVLHTSDNLCVFGDMTPISGDSGYSFSLGNKSGWYAGKSYVNFNANGPTVQIFQNGVSCNDSNGNPMAGIRSASKSVFVLNYSGNNVTYIDNKGTYKGTSSAESVELTRFFPFVNSNYSKTDHFSTKIMGVSESLSDEELNQLYNILEDFVKVFE